MKIVTYNINGIRASSNKGIVKWLGDFDADIYAIQEVRADNNTALSILYDSILNNVRDYEVILNPSARAGYSGTAILCKKAPNHYSFGFDGEDVEGRLITAYFDDFVLVNCYVPNGGTRLDFKMEYYEKLTNYLTDLKNKYKNIIFCSDSNIAHTENDVSNPSEAITKTGFLPLEQQAFSNLLSFGFVDSYREIHGKEKAYTWRSYKEILYKQSGMKYRFDYIITNIELQQKLKESNILDLPFSDHLPVANDYDFDL